MGPAVDGGQMEVRTMPCCVSYFLFCTRAARLPLWSFKMVFEQCEKKQFLDAVAPVVVYIELHQHLYRRQFQFIDRNYAALGTFQFAHWPFNSLLFMLPQDDDSESVREFRGLGPRPQKIFQDLWDEMEALAKAVASLNMVRRKGKVYIISLLDMEEEEDS
ncbi:hypothetical protein B0H11DRAFT_1917657 [Mycena galericulata]|nr:hypothetical protein B0H11DRAFT_1917657 [Mycena galericulata]